MAAFSPLHLTLDHERKKWRLTAPLSYQTGLETHPVIHVPANITTDLATTGLGRVLFPSTDPTYAPAAVLHDYLCRSDVGIAMKVADKIFFKALQSCGVATWKCWVMYLTVRFRHILARKG